MTFLSSTETFLSNKMGRSVCVPPSAYACAPGSVCGSARSAIEVPVWKAHSHHRPPSTGNPPPKTKHNAARILSKNCQHICLRFNSLVLSTTEEEEVVPLKSSARNMGTCHKLKATTTTTALVPPIDLACIPADQLQFFSAVKLSISPPKVSLQLALYDYFLAKIP